MARAEGFASVLDDASLQRYARQLLLPEIGEQGQLLLCDTYAAVGGGSERARDVCTEYLNRAGMVTPAYPGLEVVVSDEAALESLAGRPELREAAAWLAASFAAVEAIKHVVRAGRPGAIPSAFSLATEND